MMGLLFSAYRFNSERRVARCVVCLTSKFPELQTTIKYEQEDSRGPFIIVIEREEDLEKEVYVKIDSFIEGFWEGIENAC